MAGAFTPSDRIEPNAALSPVAATIMQQAARGDLNAQRRIRQVWADTFRPDHPQQHQNPDLMAASGLFVARMCAAQGDETDATMLATLLLNAGVRYNEGGRVGLGWELIAESLALYERLSAAGDPAAAQAVDALVPTLPPEVVARAQLFARSGQEVSDGTAQA